MQDKEKLPSVLLDYLSKIGKTGGAAGRGKSKVRGDKAYYAALSVKGREARKANAKSVEA
jgi:hypothetical protein